VQFLNSVIVEIQRKKEELEAAWRQSVGSAASVNGHLVKYVMSLWLSLWYHW